MHSIDMCIMHSHIYPASILKLKLKAITTPSSDGLGAVILRARTEGTVAPCAKKAMRRGGGVAGMRLTGNSGCPQGAVSEPVFPGPRLTLRLCERFCS